MTNVDNENQKATFLTLIVTDLTRATQEDSLYLSTKIGIFIIVVEQEIHDK